MFNQMSNSKFYLTLVNVLLPSAYLGFSSEYCSIFSFKFLKIRLDTVGLFVQPEQAMRSGTNTISRRNQVYDCPKLAAMLSHLCYEYADFKYTVYRCAAKFVTLQKIFYTASIPYKLVIAILERHNIKNAGPNFMVTPFQLTSIVHDMYFACEKLGHFTKAAAYNLETATSVLSNFFWNIFDPQRRHSISLLEIKFTLLLLCKLYTSDQLVADSYHLLSDQKTKCVSKLNFEYLLNTLTKILSYIGENAAYGQHNVSLVMEQCFTRCHNLNGLTENQFHCLWSTTQTRFLIYANLIALIKRLEDTEKLIHNNACASCHVDKIIGIRFKCQNCKNLSLCLKCFATGYATNKHEPRHRMYEVFAEDIPPKKISHYFGKICNLFFQKNIEETEGFCNSNETVNGNETELVTIETHRSLNASSVNAAVAALSKNKLQNVGNDRENSAIHGLTVTSSSSMASERMQAIIDRLLQQNIKVEQQLKNVKTATPEEISSFLTAHQQFLIDIINEMRNFSNSSRYLCSYPTSSTPNRSIFGAKTNIDNFGADTNLTHSMNGADINRSYLDANKSDYSIEDLSLWFNQRKMSSSNTRQPLSVLTEVEPYADDNDVNLRDTEMNNFKLLLNKVKEIVEDSYSNNTELAEATQNLENVLDSIIKSEESRRRST